LSVNYESKDFYSFSDDEKKITKCNIKQTDIHVISEKKSPSITTLNIMILFRTTLSRTTLIATTMTRMTLSIIAVIVLTLNLLTISKTTLRIMSNTHKMPTFHVVKNVVILSVEC
jgi:hypothetical protein